MKNPYGFENDGARYHVRDVHALATADADLWNDRLAIQMDQRGRVLANGFLQPNMTAYADPLRCVYVRDEKDGRFWSAPYDPVQVDPESFDFSIGTADLQWTNTTRGITTEMTLVIPPDDLVEVWSVTLTNRSERRRALSLFSYFPVGRRSYLTQRAVFMPDMNGAIHEHFDYYVKVEDLYRIRERANLVFCFGDTPPDAWELSRADFTGGRGLHDPAQLHQHRLGCPRNEWETANEDTVNVFQYRLNLAPGRSRTFRFAFGPAHTTRDAVRVARKVLRKGGMERALAAAKGVLSRYATSVRVNTPDSDFNHYINHWQSRRSLMLVRTLRHCMAPQGRNAIQDAMGGVYVDPASSRKWFTRIWTHQHRNGWLPHGMPFAEGVAQVPINSIPHKDINSWGPSALHFYMAESGDTGILDESIPFADDPKQTATLFDHVALGLEWLLRDRTARGLCRIGQGDWNDPLNMAGLKEKGESVWLSQALAMALDVWAEVAETRDDRKRASRYRKEAAALRRAINRYAWNGRWYTRGFTDEGEAFGTPRWKEGKIYLNSQSWAIMCGAADAAKSRTLIRSVERMLMAPAGPMVLGPPFTRLDERIGKLTQKIPGWNENGSVYCHASTFFAYALYVARDPEGAFRVLRSLLPGGFDNTIRRAGQVPLYIPNFYRGTAAAGKAGLSSHAPNTGTASWYYRTAIAMLLGVRAELNGLRIDPQLPAAWRHAQVWRRWRGAEFTIDIRRRKAVRRVTVRLDGTLLKDHLIPIQPEGSQHEVRVEIPA
ncbi:MAG: hypothetical protein WCI20_07450 [bacterium]